MIRVRDRERVKVVITGRFAVPREVAAETTCGAEADAFAPPCGNCISCRGLESFPHLCAVVADYRAKFVDRVCRAKGVQFVERDGLTLAGPQRHLAFVEPAPDPGPLVLPPPPGADASEEAWRTYRRVLDLAETTQRALSARRVEHAPDLVDYELVGHFLRSRIATRSHLPDTTPRSALVVPGAR